MRTLKKKSSNKSLGARAIRHFNQLGRKEDWIPLAVKYAKEYEARRQECIKGIIESADAELQKRIPEFEKQIRENFDLGQLYGIPAYLGMLAQAMGSRKNAVSRAEIIRALVVRENLSIACELARTGAYSKKYRIPHYVVFFRKARVIAVSQLSGLRPDLSRNWGAIAGSLRGIYGEGKIRKYFNNVTRSHRRANVMINSWMDDLRGRLGRYVEDLRDMTVLYFLGRAKEFAVKSSRAATKEERLQNRFESANAYSIAHMVAQDRIGGKGPAKYRSYYAPMLSRAQEHLAGISRFGKTRN